MSNMFASVQFTRYPGLLAGPGQLVYITQRQAVSNPGTTALKGLTTSRHQRNPLGPNRVCIDGCMRLMTQSHITTHCCDICFAQTRLTAASYPRDIPPAKAAPQLPKQLRRRELCKTCGSDFQGLDPFKSGSCSGIDATADVHT